MGNIKNIKWLDKFDVPQAQNGIEGTMGGLTDKGFNYNGAWGGTMQMGGSMPGAVGFMYARTQNPAPSNGPYAKKTKASAQNGKEVEYKELPEIVVVGGKDKPTIDLYRNELDKLKSSDNNPYTGAEAYAKYYAKMQMAKEFGVPKIRPAESIGTIGSFFRNRSGIKSDPNEPWPQYSPFTKTVYAGFDDDQEYKKQYIPELSHYVSQTKRKELLGKDEHTKSLLLDLWEYAKGNNPYDVEGTEENFAHSQLEPALKETYYEFKKEGRNKFMESANSSMKRKLYKKKMQNGGEMKFYQEGLDWKPRNISRDGAWLDKYGDAPQAQDGTYVKKPRTDMLTMDEYRLQKALAEQPVIQSPKGKQLSKEEINKRNKEYAQQTGKKFDEKTGKVSSRFSPQQEKTLKKVEENIVMPMLELEGAMSFAPFIGKGLKTAAKQIAKKATSFKSVGSVQPPQIPQHFLEQMRFSSLPELNNRQASEVLENFMTRINTPEGQKRLKELGITETDVFDKIKIVADENTLGQYWMNKIGLHPELPEMKRVTRHEIEHAVQDAFTQSKTKEANKFRWTDLFGNTKKPDRVYKALNRSTTDIDEGLKNLELRKTPQEVNWNEVRKNDDKSNPQNLFDYMSNRQRATDYFTSGSEGREKSAFLAEVQQYMTDQGILPKTSYKEVTPEMVENVFIDAMFDEKNGGKYLRLFNIMKPTENNYKIVAEGLNKMLGVIPPAAVIGGAAAIEQKREGGDIKKDDNGYWNPENWGEPVTNWLDKYN